MVATTARPRRSAAELEAEISYKRERAAALEVRQGEIKATLTRIRHQDGEGVFAEETGEIRTLVEEGTWLATTLAALRKDLDWLTRAHGATARAPALPESDTNASPYSDGESNASAVRASGCVRGFERKRGFGFIEPDDGSTRVFCHKSALQGARVLRDGQRVTYIVSNTDPRGPSALDVIAVEGE